MQLPTIYTMFQGLQGGSSWQDDTSWTFVITYFSHPEVSGHIEAESNEDTVSPPCWREDTACPEAGCHTSYMLSVSPGAVWRPGVSHCSFYTSWPSNLHLLKPWVLSSWRQTFSVEWLFHSPGVGACPRELEVCDRQCYFRFLIGALGLDILFGNK